MYKSRYRQVMTAIEGKLNLLALSNTLPVDQAIQRAQEIATLVEKAAAPLEEEGHFEEAANLYDKAAQAFESAAHTVSETERGHLYARADFWSAKADVTRYRVYTAPTTLPVEGEGKGQGRPSLAPSTDIAPSERRRPEGSELLPKARPKSRTSTSRAPRSSTGTFSKGGEIKSGRLAEGGLAEGAWTATPPPTVEPKSAASALGKPNDSQGKRQSAAPSTPSEEHPRRPPATPPEVWRKKPPSE